MSPKKFRGKRKDNGEWLYGYYVHNCFANYDKHFIYTADGFMAEVHPETVGQFTGLKDKDGKEVYEGDIVVHNVPEKLPGGKLNLNKHIAQEMTVKWNDILCGFNLIKTAHPSYEVIGNIHTEEKQ